MTPKQRSLALGDELVVDLFAGGGGASLGIEWGLGRPVDVAVNHDPEAVAVHVANHPHTTHYCESVFTVDPVRATRGLPVGLLWASPDCKHFSKAKGSKPVSRRVRSLAWVVVRWAKRVRPRVIMLENVEEFATWGPVGRDGVPCKRRQGETFALWIAQIERLGYRVEHRLLRACDYGAPTIRRRLFLVARRDGRPIVWPAPTHGAPDSLPVRRGRRAPWRTAAECIDWTIPCPSIFERRRPLADATLRRIAAGIRRYVIESARPFIVPVTHQGDCRVHGIDEPLRTVTTAQRGELALTVPTLVQTGYGERAGQAPRVPGLGKPLGTAVSGGQKHALVAAFLAKHFTGVVGSALQDPLATVTTIDHHSLVTAQLEGRRGCDEICAFTDQGRSDRDQGGRHDLEEEELEPHAACCPASTGDADEARVSGGEVLGRGEAVHAGGAPAGLHGTEGTDPRRDGHQPRRRGQGEQQAGEPRAGNPRREPRARLPHRLAEYHGHAARSGRPREDIAGGGAELHQDRAGLGCVSDHRFPGHSREVAAFLNAYYGTDQDPRLDEPLHTVTTRDRFAVVTVAGLDYYIADIGLRMLTPRELFRAQGFPDSYRIDGDPERKPLTKGTQIRLVGNSVCPPVAHAIVAANFRHEAAWMNTPGVAA